MKGAAVNHCGFSLVEVTLALGVASVCLIAIFGLLPVGLRTNQDAIQQVAAARYSWDGHGRFACDPSDNTLEEKRPLRDSSRLTFQRIR